MYIEDAIPNMRIVRDDTLSLCHLADPPDEAAANASLADACEDALRYFDAFHCCYGPMTILPHDRHGMTGEEGAMLAAYQRHEAQAENRAAIPHAGLDALCGSFGAFSLTQQDLLRDPTYLSAGDLIAIAPEGKESLSRLQPEFTSLGIKKAVQMRMKDVLRGEAGKSREEVIRELYPMIRQMPLGTSTTNWQLHELDAINVLMHGTSLRPDIEERLATPLAGMVDLSRPALSKDTPLGPVLMQEAGQDIQKIADQLTENIDRRLADRTYGQEENPRVHLVIYGTEECLDAMMHASRSLRTFFKAHREEGRCSDTARVSILDGKPVIKYAMKTMPDDKTRLAFTELAVRFPGVPIYLDNQKLKPSEKDLRRYEKRQSAGR